MKKIICGIAVFMSIFVLSACNNSSEEAPLSTESEASTQQEVEMENDETVDEPADEPADEPKAVAKDVKIGFMVQEYIDDNIAEIPYFEVDGASTDEIDAMNRSVNVGIRKIYDEFMANRSEEDREWMEIKSYPFTSENYLQVVVNYCTYPTYGTEGELFSINYSKDGKWLTIGEAMEKLDVNQEVLPSDWEERIKAEESNNELYRIETVAVIIREEPYTLDLFYKVYMKTVEDEVYDAFYYYNTADGSFKKLLYDDNLSWLQPDKTDPPLHYMK